MMNGHKKSLSKVLMNLAYRTMPMQVLAMENIATYITDCRVKL